MTNLQTGIAVALALIVVGSVFVFPGLLSFIPSVPAAASVATTTDDTLAPNTETPMITELQVTDEVVGTGAVVQAGDTVTVNYVGMLDNGQVFDASANHGGPASFAIGVGQVIPGWDQGIVGMKEGGKRKLVIPSALAYGDQGIPGVIPGGATLTFEVELVKVTHGGK